MMTLSILWCLAGTCETHDVPLPEVMSQQMCMAWAQAKIIEQQLLYPSHTPTRWKCVRGVRT